MSLIRSLTRGAIGGAVQNKTLGRGVLGAGLGLIASRIALRSVPGALLVSGGLVAKHFWDKHREKQAREQELSPQDADMAVARAEGEPDIAEGAAPANGGIATVV